MVPQLSVAENIFLSSLPMKNPACIDWKRVYSDAQTIIDSLEVDINVRSRISSLGIAQQQMVEIAKALNHQAKVIVMDEPSAPLTDKETAKLFKTIAKLKSEGVAVIYISHRLEETMQIADRATIMRDGQDDHDRERQRYHHRRSHPRHGRTRSEGAVPQARLSHR